MNQPLASEDQAWLFPELDNISQDMTQAKFSLLPEMQAAEKFEAKQKAFDEQCALKMQEIEAEKTNLHAKIEHFQQLINKLANPFSIVEAEVIELLIATIKKLSLRLIQRELSVEPKLINELVESLKSHLAKQDSIINIHLAKEGYDALQASGEKNPLYTLDPSLHAGDVIIKTNFSELHALLNERIEALVKLHHD